MKSFKYFFLSFCIFICAVVTSFAQRTPIPQGPTFNRGGGSPLGGGAFFQIVNQPFAGSVLLSDGTIYYWGSVTNLEASVTNAAQTVSLEGVTVTFPTLQVDFVSIGGTTVTVTPSGTTAIVGIPSTANAITNNDTRAVVFVNGINAGTVSVGNLAGEKALIGGVGPGATIEEANTTSQEIEYVHGVTSAIQGQLNAKLDGTNDIFNTATTFNGVVSNSNGGFWATDTEGFISYSSPTDFMIMSHPQGGIFNTLDDWVLGDGKTFASILTLNTNNSHFLSNLVVGATNFAREIKLIGGQAASSLLRLDANTNLAAVTIGSGISWDGTTLGATGGGGTGSTNPVAFTSGFNGTTNWVGVGYTNTGSNAVQVIDLMGPPEITCTISGDTVLVLTNMPAWTNTSYGSTIRINTQHQVGNVTFGSLHPINFGPAGYFLSSGDTNLTTIRWTGTNIMGFNSHTPYLFHASSAAVLTFDSQYAQANLFSVTNRLTANTIGLVTNLNDGKQFRLTVMGEAASGANRTFQLIPDSGIFIINMNTNAASRISSKTDTITNGTFVEYTGEVLRMLGTNILKLSTAWGTL